jgi:hypothetical protein
MAERTDSGRVTPATDDRNSCAECRSSIEGEVSSRLQSDGESAGSA